MSDADSLALGREALQAGDWATAKEAFEKASVEDDSAEALDGLGRAMWWMKDVRSAIEIRTRAYGAYKKADKPAEAAAIAVWLAREFRTLFRNDPAADGWLARAYTLSAAGDDSPVRGWILLARSEAETDVLDAVVSCRSALDAAREVEDPDLEIVALARLGLLRVAQGEVDSGIAHLDEAMAAASAGEASDLQSVGDAYCALMEAAEMLGDTERFAQWTKAIAQLKGNHGFGPLDDFGSPTAYRNLSTFCAACCGGMYLVTGRLDEAEDELRRAIGDLEESGMDSRCVHPVTQLGELRVLQGRFEEARALLGRYEDLPEAVRPLAILDLALGSPQPAKARVRHRLTELSDLTVPSLTLLTVLLDAEIVCGDLTAAAQVAKRIHKIASVTKSKRHHAEALYAKGKLSAALSQEESAADLRAAASAFSEVGMALSACRARMQLARVLVESDRPVAITEARAALAAFDRLGAVPDADGAAAFLRELGVKGRTGPKNLELLSKRELEVLRLVAQGLSNPEIAERLFISVKTAGHHVSSILSKLGLRSRTEAAAYAAIHLGGEPVAR
jgi:DNA-binding NarL/FixJ family response regulator